AGVPRCLRHIEGRPRDVRRRAHTGAGAGAGATTVGGVRMRVLMCNGSVESVRSVARALAEALSGGAAGLPGSAAEHDRLVAAAKPDVGSDAAVLVATSGSAGELKIVELSA